MFANVKNKYYICKSFSEKIKNMSKKKIKLDKETHLQEVRELYKNSKVQRKWLKLCLKNIRFLTTHH